MSTLDTLFSGHQNARTREEGFVAFVSDTQEEAWRALRGLSREDFNILIEEVEDFFRRERQVEIDLGLPPIFNEVSRDEVSEWLGTHSNTLLSALEKSMQDKG